MKIFLSSMILLLLGHEAFSQIICRDDCEDILGQARCSLMSDKCGGITAVFCQQTCGKCLSCSGPRELPSNNNNKECELGTCVDIRNPLECALYKQRFKSACVLLASQCRATCGLCKGCILPPTEQACSQDCKDSDSETCAYWKDQGYCDVKKGFPHTRVACPLTCGTCKPCPTEAPTIVKFKKDPITPIPCEKCDDTNEHCAHWEGEGYCDESKGFPDTLKACPKTCGVCKPCSDVK